MPLSRIKFEYITGTSNLQQLQCDRNIIHHIYVSVFRSAFPLHILISKNKRNLPVISGKSNCIPCSVLLVQCCKSNKSINRVQNNTTTFKPFKKYRKRIITPINTGRQEVSRCRTRGEPVESVASERICPGFETPGRRTSSAV